LQQVSGRSGDIGSSEELRQLWDLGLGLALAVRPAGLAEVSRVNGRHRLVPRSGMRGTVKAGGASPDNGGVPARWL